MNKDEKHSKIKELFNEQKRLVKKAVAVAKLPEPKRQITVIKRAQKVLMLMINARQIEVQKQMLITTPITEGFVSGGMIIAEPQEREVVINKKGEVINFIHPITFRSLNEAQKPACNLCDVSNSALEFDLKDLKETLKNQTIKK